MATGDFLSGFQSNLGWLQQIPSTLSGISGNTFDIHSGLLAFLGQYGQYVDLAFGAFFVIVGYMTARTWWGLREEV